MSPLRTMLRLTTTAIALAAVAACGGSGDSSTGPSGGGRTITASAALVFTPASLTVDAGDVVTFAFGSVPHNVFFDAVAGAPADIEGAVASATVTRDFASPGTYHYDCHIHPGMSGTVVVQ